MKATFREIRSDHPCKDGWSLLCNNILKTDFPEDPKSWKECQLSEEQLDTEVSILEILESNGVEDAFWALQTQEYRDYCLILADVAESVLHIWEERYPNDNQPRLAVSTIRKWYSGEATDKELRNAASAVAGAAAGASAYAANAAADAAYAYAAGNAANDVAADAANAAADVAADYADAADAAYAAARKKQWEVNEKILR